MFNKDRVIKVITDMMIANQALVVQPIIIDSKRIEMRLLTNYTLGRVLEIKHYTNELFSFRTTKLKRFKFKPGMYATIGLIIRKELVFRDYYICNPTWDNRLEFYSMTVPNGLFTSFLRKIVVKSSVIIKTKTNGELTLATLKPGKRLFLFCSDIGIIPAISIISEPETYSNFNEVVVVISCKHTKELSYFNSKLKQLAKEPKIKPYARGKLRFYQSITQEPYPYSDDITWLIRSGTLIADLRTHTFNKMDRFMVCGQQQTAVNNIVLLKDLGYDEGTVKHPGDFTYEKKFINPILNLSPGSDVLLGRIKTEHPNQQLQLPSPEGTVSKEIIITSKVYSRGVWMLEAN